MTRPLQSWRRVRLSLVRESTPAPYMRTGADVAALCAMLLPDDPREQFGAVYLDARQRVLAVHLVGTGGADACPVSPRDVFGPALQLGAVACVVCHRHPSGDPTPSLADRQVTERLREAGELLGVEMLDHVVLGDGRHFSFADGTTSPTSGAAVLP